MFISYGVHIDAPPQQIWDVLLDIERSRNSRRNTQQEVEGLKAHIEAERA